MALDPSIALGIKPVQIESPINQMAKMYEMQNIVQSNKLNQMKMDEYTRGVTEDEAIRNYFAQQDRTSPDFVKGLYGISPKTGQAYEKAQMEALKEKAAIGETEAKTKTAEFERKSKQLNIMGQAFGFVRTNPTPQAATNALNYLVSNGVIDKAQADEQLALINRDPSPANIKALADQGFIAVLSAKEQLPTFQMQSTGGATRVLGINPVTGKADVVQGSEAKLTATPGDLLSAQTQRRGQDLINTRELEKIALEKGKNSFEYIAAEAKAKEKGKQAAVFEATAPQAIVKAEEAIRKIDELIGDTTIDRKGKLQYGKVKPHPGFSVSVGASAQPGFQYLSGSDKADFYARIEEIQGQAFMQAFETLKGGGAITETEGIKGTKAITRMSTAQSEPEFIRAATEFKSIVRKGLENAKNKLAPATGDVDANNPLLN